MITRRAWISLGVGVVALPVISSVASAAARVPTVDGDPPEGDPPEDKDVFGMWRYVGGERQRKAVEEAIDDAIADMSPLIRGIARRRLLDSNGVPASIDLRIDGSNIVITFPGIRSLSAPSSGAAIDWRSEQRDKVRVTHTLKDNTLLEQRFVGEGTRVNRFVLQPGGDKLILKVTITASRLPKDLHYRLSYTRLKS